MSLSISIPSSGIVYFWIVKKQRLKRFSLSILRLGVPTFTIPPPLSLSPNPPPPYRSLPIPPPPLISLSQSPPPSLSPTSLPDYITAVS